MASTTLCFATFPQLLRPDDLLVFNNTRVLPARLFGHRSGSRAQPLSTQNPAAKEFLRGRVEVLLTKQLSANPPEWEALVHPGRKLGLGERIYFGGEANESSHELAAEIVGRGTFGERRLRFDPVDDFFGVLNRIGHIPLPPYIDRPDTPSDRECYQTIYAKPLGSVAAPTAGLHFTPEILQQVHQRGIETAEITLHVGLGTFQPVREDVVEQHKLHREWYEISEDAAQRIQSARDAGRRIVAVGTTTVRTLEFAALKNADWPDHGAAWRGRHLYLSRIRVSRARGHAHQLPPAEIDSADAGFGFRRTRADAASLRTRRPAALPVLFVRRLHVGRVGRALA